MPAPTDDNPFIWFKCPRCDHREWARKKWAPQCSAFRDNDPDSGKRCETRMKPE